MIALHVWKHVARQCTTCSICGGVYCAAVLHTSAPHDSSLGILIGGCGYDGVLCFQEATLVHGHCMIMP
eukprot:5525466-Amphidinium_carterae.1